MSQTTLERYLRLMVHYKGSDLHLKTGSVPYVRVEGSIYPIDKADAISSEEMLKILRQVLREDQISELFHRKEYDTSYSLDTATRFRVNCFEHIGGWGAVFRAIPAKIPDFEALQLPAEIKDFSRLSRGFVLVTGPTGSGKSTTLAALIQAINRQYRRHILTIEDPIEFIFPEIKSIITQRAVKVNTSSYAAAVTAAFREDFDVLLLGEIRDLKTMRSAIHAANTGHLVFSTLHTGGSAETIHRIVNMFPQSEQIQIRQTLAKTLEGIIGLRLVEDIEGKRIPATEIVKRTSLVSDLIMEGNENEILDVIAKGSNTYGMWTFDQDLARLYKEGKITKETALANASNPSDLQLLLEGISKI